MDSKEQMIENQLRNRDIYDEKVLQAMRAVDREIFIPGNLNDMAYEDTPLPIGRGQTISQPYIVAYMAQTLNLSPEDKVLEVGSGCGYNAAIISRMVSHVYSIEIIEWLAEVAKENLKKADIPNVIVHSGDGLQGWPEKSPFDKIILTAATPGIPEKLKNQLKIGGKILAPITNTFQKLMLIEKKGEDEFKDHDLIHVRFVPMTGETEQ